MIRRGKAAKTCADQLDVFTAVFGSQINIITPSRRISTSSLAERRRTRDRLVMGRYAGKITCNIHSFDWRPERRSWLDVVLSASKAAYAQSVMKLCGEQWKAAKAAGTTNGETWPQFLAQCRVPQSGGAAPAAPTYAPAPAAPLPTYGQAAGGAGKTTSQCDAEYAANKAAIRASGQNQARVCRFLPRRQ